MGRKINKGPLQRLKNKVAQPGDLRSMSAGQRRTCSCRYCDITYRDGSSARACERWHEGRGT